MVSLSLFLVSSDWNLFSVPSHCKTAGISQARCLNTVSRHPQNTVITGVGKKNNESEDTTEYGVSPLIHCHRTDTTETAPSSVRNCGVLWMMAS